MNWDAIGAIGQVIGAVGVIASLTYLATQIGLDAKARRASAVHGLIEAFREYSHMLATDGDLGAIHLRGIRDFGSLTDSELLRFSAAFGFLLRLSEEAHFQWEEGNLDPQLWHGFEAPMKDLFAYSGVRDWWSTRCHWYNQPFQEYVRRMIAEVGAPKLYGESDA